MSRVAGVGVVGVVEHLVMKALAGRHEVVEDLLRYISGGGYEGARSSKHVIRGQYQRIVEKAGDRWAASAAVLAFGRYALRIESVIERGNGLPVCRACGRALVNMFPEDHIRKHHPDLIREGVRRVLSEWRSDRAPSRGWPA